MRRSGAKDEAYEGLLLMVIQGHDVRMDPSLAPAAMQARGEDARAMQRASRHASEDPKAAQNRQPAAVVAEATEATRQQQAAQAKVDEGGPAEGKLGKRFNMDAAKLSKAWEARQRSTAEDWQEWMHALTLDPTSP